MAIGISLMLIAAGAILAFAVNATVNGLDVMAIGVILIIVGLVGLAISLLFLASFAPYYRGRTHEEIVHREL